MLITHGVSHIKLSPEKSKLMSIMPSIMKIKWNIEMGFFFSTCTTHPFLFSILHTWER